MKGQWIIPPKQIFETLRNAYVLIRLENVEILLTLFIMDVMYLDLFFYKNLDIGLYVMTVYVFTFHGTKLKSELYLGTLL